MRVNVARYHRSELHPINQTAQKPVEIYNGHIYYFSYFICSSLNHSFIFFNHFQNLLYLKKKLIRIDFLISGTNYPSNLAKN